MKHFGYFPANVGDRNPAFINTVSNNFSTSSTTYVDVTTLTANCADRFKVSSGAITCYQDGLYLFSFTGDFYSSNPSTVGVYLAYNINGGTDIPFVLCAGEGVDVWLPFQFRCNLQLTENDVFRLRVLAVSPYSANVHVRSLFLLQIANLDGHS